jgi:replication-associated recombination protein RarA
MVSQMKTMSGYTFDEVFSSLQKMIRRSDEKMALYWATELEHGFPSHLWNRLEIIAAEDIGIGDLTAVIAVRLFKEQYFEAKQRKNDAFRLFLANAILALCRAPKTRIADNLVQVVYRGPRNRPIPDVGKDKHTRAGRHAGKGWQHFFDEGVLLIQPDGLIGDCLIDESAQGYATECRNLVEQGVPYVDADIWRAKANGTTRRDDGPEEGQSQAELIF